MARRQHGVVSIRQLTGPLGYSKSAVARAARSGRLHRLHQGVYAVGHTDLSPRGWCLAAVLACGPGAVLSHHSAAWLWGIRRQGPAPELDLYWPGQRFAVELDSYATHGTHGAFERDRLRQEDLLLVGVGMTRVTDVRFASDPDSVIARVARLLERRAGTAGKAGLEGDRG